MTSDEYRRTWSTRFDELLSRSRVLDEDDQAAVLAVHETLLAEQFSALPTAEPEQATDRIESTGLSELEQYAADLVYAHANDVEYLTVREMAEVHLGREITDDEAKQVHDLISRAEVVVGFPAEQDSLR